MADEDEIDGVESSGNETNLSNPFTFKKSTKAGYLISRNTKKASNNPKKGGGNTKKSVKTAKSFNYLTPNAKKDFNYLHHTFT